MSRAVLIASLSVSVLIVAGCGQSASKLGPPPLWVKRSNAICKLDDGRAESGAFDSPAMISGLQHEAKALKQAGFFERLPAAALDVETAGDLLSHASPGDFGTLRRADRALLRARHAAAHKGVHCSFATVPLQNL
jgi:hypothetical protein